MFAENEEVQKRSVRSAFRRCDLHLHTRLTLSERGREVGCLNDKVINLTTVGLLILMR